ncbi:MAG: autotransporter outer membrane beta-barrel domain-containing protein [Planctomycetota bacterium]|jgi:hypothetical protein|nr:autotransporter outer membrane beta-barrel domain-containing protein [Planctomycetota bacterium]
MIKMKYFSRMVLAGAMLTGAAQAVEITDVSGLNSVSTTQGDTYVLSSGEYSVTSPVHIHTQTFKNLAIGGGSALNITSTTTNGSMFTVASMEVNGGSLVANGSDTGAYATGVRVSANLVLNDGEVRVKGGVGRYRNWGLDLTDYNQGITVKGITVKGGILSAIGGDSGESNNGIWGLGEREILQTAGIVFSYGGGGTHNAGIYIWDYRQTGGRLVARPGDGYGSHGIFVDNDLVIGGELVIQRGGSALTGAVVVGFDEDVDYGNKLEFLAGSKLTLDLAGTGRLPVIYANKAQIGNDVALEFYDAAALANGASVTHEFLIAQYGIAGDFVFANSSTLDITAAKSADNKNYAFTFTRQATAGDLAATLPGLGSNAFSLLIGLDALYGTGAYPEMLADLSRIDFMEDQEEIVEYANHLVQKYMPADATRIVNAAFSLNRMIGKAMISNLFAPVGNQLAAAASGSPDALASLARPSGAIRSFWASPFAQWTKTKPIERGFSKANENVYGIGLGSGIRQENNFALGGGIHYLRSELHSRSANIDSDMYGCNVLGRGYFANGSIAHPFLQGGLGYTFSDSKQTRKLSNNVSSPDMHIFNANLAFGSDIEAGRWTFVPSLGIDYTFIRTGAYTERGPSALSVQRNDVNSVRGVIGMGVKSQVTDRFYVTATADYRHEFGDRNSTVKSCLTQLPAVQFVAEGERRSRSSGNVGAGIGWQARQNVLINLNYELGIAQKQRSHAVDARFTLDF